MNLDWASFKHPGVSDVNDDGDSNENTNKKKKKQKVSHLKPFPASSLPGKNNKDDPLELKALFGSGGESWLPLLKPMIERQLNAAKFVGPKRSKTIVPVRELTFQALKPNPPEKWNVIILGQSPYPRVESATGIAMFDNSFHTWDDKRFGRVTSMRCIIKSALMASDNYCSIVNKRTPVKELRTILKKNKVLQPPSYFKALLTQGCLLLNASLTSTCDTSVHSSGHNAFWRPVIKEIVKQILKAKEQTDDSKYKGVVFVWWGTKAQKLRQFVQNISPLFRNVPIRHVSHCNPAAIAESFCTEGVDNPLVRINNALGELKMGPVDWLPCEGEWDASHKPSEKEIADRMSIFIEDTMVLHQSYLKRLSDLQNEVPLFKLAPIEGISKFPLVPLSDAVKPLFASIKSLPPFLKNSLKFAREDSEDNAVLKLNERAAVHLYTQECGFYRKLNEKLRDPLRKGLKVYFPYLKLLTNALGKLPKFTKKLYRGVKADLAKDYPVGKQVVWWGVSSCTSDIKIAKEFIGNSGSRTLFCIQPISAVSIQRFSAFKGEDEYVIPPGRFFKVQDIRKQSTGN
mmetsp:Transcript_11395/g.15772  ORF Transcript_11395/g.15772 Transcript_11395/m.15772 type:complete len:571 (+) Transcript_11395:1-1713(+)